MTLPAKIAIFILPLLIGFALGILAVRCLAPAASTSVQQLHDNKDTHTVTVTTRAPTGAVTTTTTSDTQEVAVSTASVTQTSSKEAPRTHISLLAGYNLTRPLDGPLYGFAVSRQLIGPITVGAWGLTNGTLGASVGVSF